MSVAFVLLAISNPQIQKQYPSSWRVVNRYIVRSGTDRWVVTIPGHAIARQLSVNGDPDADKSRNLSLISVRLLHVGVSKSPRRGRERELPRHLAPRR